MNDDIHNERLDPLSDPVFSCLFADESTTVSMLEIINAVLTDAGDPPIQRIVAMNSQYDLIAENIGRKNGRLDVRAVSENGELFDIEVQLRTMRAMNDRAWFYGSRLMSDSFREGDAYDSVPRVRVINLLDFVLRDTHPDYLQPIGVLYKKGIPEIATDAFRIYNIELPKFRAQNKTLNDVKADPLKRWLYLFEEGYKDEREMEVLTDMTEGLKAFASKYNRSLSDPKLRRLYELDLSARRDERAVIQTAENEGRQKGRAEGRTEERTALIRNMIADGVQIEAVYRYVNAPRAEIDAIIDGLRKGK